MVSFLANYLANVLITVAGLWILDTFVYMAYPADCSSHSGPHHSRCTVPPPEALLSLQQHRWALTCGRWWEGCRCRPLLLMLLLWLPRVRAPPALLLRPRSHNLKITNHASLKPFVVKKTLIFITLLRWTAMRTDNNRTSTCCADSLCVRHGCDECGNAHRFRARPREVPTDINNQLCVLFNGTVPRLWCGNCILRIKYYTTLEKSMWNTFEKKLVIELFFFITIKSFFVYLTIYIQYI